MSTPPAYSYWFPDPAHPPVAHGPASSPGSEAPGSGAPKAGAPKSGAPQSGTPHGLVWPHGFALLDAAIAPDVADALWLHAPATLGEFIDTLRTLTAAPIPGPTSFAVAFGQGGDWRLAVNGSARASVGREDDVVVIESDGSRWAERQLDKVVRLGLSMGEHAVTAGASGRPIVAGVVPSMAVLRVMQVASYAVDALDASVAYAPAPDPSHPVATPDPSTPIATPDPSTPIATPDPSTPIATPDPST
ncbi:MAG TPA: hypothetical protein GXZ30_14065, partial [Propionibacterium sp.]|nr:hypothetical protein [Propionibacterium sp.]